MSSNGDNGPMEVSPPSSPGVRASSIHSRSSRSSRSRSSSRSSRSSHRSRSAPRSRSRSSSRHSADAIPTHLSDNHHGSSNHHHHSDSKHDSSHHEAKPESPVMSYGDDESWPPHHPFLSRLALPIALVVGTGIIGGTTYAVVARVQNLIANASIDGDISSWKRRARDDVYDACYNGCTSCDDPSFAYNACQKTASAVIKGINCDGARMWNWAVEDRYPDQCLAAVAAILMGEALEALKQSYRNQLALITVTVLGGFLAGFLTYKAVRMATMTKAERRAARSRRMWSLFKPRTWHLPSLSKYEAPAAKKTRGGMSLSSASTTGGKKKKLTAVFAGLLSARKASAYPCAGRDAAWSQFFASPSGAGGNASVITGVVHSWFSECRDRRDCTRSCRNSCSTSSSGSRTCSTKCTETCTTTTYTERIPKDYVDAVLPKIRACGFSLVDALGGSNGAAVTTRVANAGIERNLWVRISVNGLNVTKPTETDPMVLCLHAIGD